MGTSAVIALFTAGLLATVMAVTLALADVPRMIDYQGLVVDQDTGNPLPGEHTIVFRIYDAASGGSVLWSEEQQVTADDMGVLSAIAGSASEIDLSFEGSYWLEVQVGGQVLTTKAAGQRAICLPSP